MWWIVGKAYVYITLFVCLTFLILLVFDSFLQNKVWNQNTGSYNKAGRLWRSHCLYLKGRKTPSSQILKCLISSIIGPQSVVAVHATFECCCRTVLHCVCTFTHPRHVDTKLLHSLTNKVFTISSFQEVQILTATFCSEGSHCTVYSTRTITWAFWAALIVKFVT